MAFAIGEFKELLDSNRGGSGFSFDDIAADRAGIRFAETLFAGGKRAELKTSKLDQLRSEKAIMPSIKGLPSGMTEAEFKRRFGDIDSDRYKNILAVIDKRIDKLAFHTGG